LTCPTTRKKTAEAGPTEAGVVAFEPDLLAALDEQRLEQRDDLDDEADVEGVEEGAVQDELLVERHQQLVLQSHGQLVEDYLLGIEPLVSDLVGGVLDGCFEFLFGLFFDVEFLAELVEVVEFFGQQRVFGFLAGEEGGDDTDGEGVEGDADEHPEDAEADFGCVSEGYCWCRRCSLRSRRW
jgi:hypothetical protein